MKSGFIALAVFLILEYLFVLLKIDILEDFNIFRPPQLLFVLFGYLAVFGIIEYATRHTSTTKKLISAGVLAFAIFATILGLSFTTSDGIARGIAQFLAFLAVSPIVIYMIVVYLQARQTKNKQETPNQAL